MKSIRVDTEIPLIALPTILLSFLSFFIWISMFYFRMFMGIPFYITLVPSTVSTYLAFTPLHDAIHGSISKYKRINNIPAYLASVQYFYSPYSIFRILHLLHHRHTNDSELDPDYYSTSRYTLFLPVKWLSHIFHYFTHFYNIRHKYYRESKDLLYWYLFFVLPILAVFPTTDLLILWLIPSHIAITFMVFMFDYIPHKPHVITRKQNKYMCSNIVDSVFSEDINIGEIPHESFLLSIFTLNQSYHSIHHLFPRIPFYKYHKIWKKYSIEFKKMGVPSVPIVEKPNIELHSCLKYTD